LNVSLVANQVPVDRLGITCSVAPPPLACGATGDSFGIVLAALGTGLRAGNR